MLLTYLILLLTYSNFHNYISDVSIEDTQKNIVRKIPNGSTSTASLPTRPPKRLRMGSSAKLESSSVSDFQKTSVAVRYSNASEYSTYRERCAENDLNEMVELRIQIPVVGGA